MEPRKFSHTVFKSSTVNEFTFSGSFSGAGEDGSSTLLFSVTCSPPIFPESSFNDDVLGFIFFSGTSSPLFCFEPVRAGLPAP